MTILHFIRLWCLTACLALREWLQGCRSEFVFEGRLMSRTAVCWAVAKRLGRG